MVKNAQFEDGSGPPVSTLPDAGGLDESKSDGSETDCAGRPWWFWPSQGWLGSISENAELAAQRYGSGLGRSTSGCERTDRNAERKRNWWIVRSGSWQHRGRISTIRNITSIAAYRLP